MKLFFSPGACSLSPHIILHEAGLKHTSEKVDLRNKVTASGADFRVINPKGYVPALQLDDGSYLTEGPAIVQYLADLVPEKKLAPPLGTMERYRLMETLAFISTELHKNFSPLFNPAITEANKEATTKMLKSRFALIANQLGNSDFIQGSQFTVADAYLFVMLLWAKKFNISLTDSPNLLEFQQRIAERPAVLAVMKAEGLTKS